MQVRSVRFNALAAALALAALSAPAFAGQVYLGNLQDQGNSRFIVKFRSGSAPAGDAKSLSGALNRAAERVASPGAATGPRLRTVRAMIMPGARVVASDRALDRAQATALMRQIAADENVEFVQLDGISRMMMTPNDPSFAQQWHYADSAAGIRLPTAWNASTGAGVVVAVIDSGIASHTDLNANVLPGYDFVSSSTGFSEAECRPAGATAGCGRSDDGDGRDANPADVSDVMHGTHVAGTIAAVTNNNLGVAGVAFNAKIVPLRVLGKDGVGSDSDIADAIVWASGGSVSGVPANANPAEVINLSLGGGAPCSQTPAYQAAINAAVGNGSTVIVAAGNNNTDVANFTPASCNNAVSVAASNRNGARSYYSNFGASMDITAPGGAQSAANDANGILSTYRNNGYRYEQGTSMAAPHAAGVAALILSAAPSKTPAQVEQILKSTARPISASNCSGGCGAGLIDAAAAVAAAGGSTGPGPGTGTQTYSNGNDVAIGDNTTVESTIAVAGRSGNAPANASVSFNIVHTYRGDLKVDLVAPDGSLYNLHNRTGGGADNLSGTFSLNLSSEALNGNWKLRVNDNANGDTGRIDTWSITF
ncbi:S8 family serine peptidase [Lysobacter enzymogenes]|uniref:S8 family serine peptidase n=1 Tax=Lysobacter enzymogenes TaxID=69 RepID=UPI0008957B07|nr:S8 family serine peptidase [Lysobacter enzymogenes]SDW35751.1 serine protease [Lysobacter enzymogenes]